MAHATTVRVSLFSKNHNFFINSDGDKLYTKLVAFDEIYNFVVQTFLFEVIFGLKNLIYCPDLSFRYPYLESISIF
jgi:hypothetical protein